jgi:hypothetical protein
MVFEYDRARVIHKFFDRNLVLLILSEYLINLFSISCLVDVINSVTCSIITTHNTIFKTNPHHEFVIHIQTQNNHFGVKKRNKTEH